MCLSPFVLTAVRERQQPQSRRMLKANIASTPGIIIDDWHPFMNWSVLIIQFVDWIEFNFANFESANFNYFWFFCRFFVRAKFNGCKFDSRLICRSIEFRQLGCLWMLFDLLDQMLFIRWTNNSLNIKSTAMNKIAEIIIGNRVDAMALTIRLIQHTNIIGNIDGGKKRLSKATSSAERIRTIP